MDLLLTAYNGSILGPIARLMGLIMDWIYRFITGVCGIYNGSIAITIILFTIFIYLCLLPLTYKQQKFSMLQRKIQPELNEIQKKYRGKNDPQSRQLMTEETQVLYDKYGVSPAGSCVQLMIQMPILFALYRVFYNVPAYLASVKSVFSELVGSIVKTDGYATAMKKIYEEANIRALTVSFAGDGSVEDKNYVIDVLYKLSEDGWKSVSAAFPDLTSQIDALHDTLSKINYLGVLNISDTPINLAKHAFDAHTWGVFFAAILVPLLSYASQVINLRMIPQQNSDDQMGSQMKVMNNLMPFMSLFFTFVTPIGLGIYWITGAIVRTVQQIILNKHFEKIDIEEIIEKNKEKAAEKAEKRGAARMSAYAMQNTRSLSDKAKISDSKNEALDQASALRSTARKGTLADKANMVERFNNEGK